MNIKLIVDIDLTLYSLAEFLTAHPRRLDRWVHALWRISEQQADDAIDQAWLKWESSITERIQYFQQWGLERHHTAPLFFTANPLTAAKARTFSRLGGLAQSCYPQRKIEFIQNSLEMNKLQVELSIGDRLTDAPLAAHFLHIPISGKTHRLTGDRYTSALKELLCFKASQM